MPDMASPLNPSAQKVQDALVACGFSNRVVEMPATTRTSAEAAQAVGCAVGQIAKSLVLRGKTTHNPVLIIASGANRVSEKAIAALIGEAIEKPDADYVRARTGFVIGGVPPLGHSEALRTLIDQDLMQYEEIWAAAGTPFAVFKLKPAELVQITGGSVAAIRA